jgi:hypothetical protein
MQNKTAKYSETPPIPRTLTTQLISTSIRDLKPKGHTAAVGFSGYGLGVSVRIDFQDQPFGGHRAFFRCPGCDRRCKILYAERYLGATGWRCRKCWGLAYPSQRQRGSRRQWSRALRLSEQLLDPENPKLLSRPRGMHGATFSAKVRRIRDLEERALMASIRRLKHR